MHVLLAAFLTINDIVAQHPVDGTPPRNFTWAPDGSAYVYSIAGAREGDPPILRIYDLRTHTDRALLRARSEQRGSRSRDIAQIAWSNDSRKIALTDAGALDVLDRRTGSETQLARDADDPQWSPDDSRIAYVHGGDLYAIAAGGGTPLRLTSTGSQTRTNGDPDWLYSEEMDVEHAFAWSPDGTKIAYLSFDESHVHPFPVQNYIPRINTVEMQRYPLAGDPNPRVSLNVLDVATKASRMLYDGAARDEYVLSFTWSPKGDVLLNQIVDRPQQHLRWVAFSSDGSSRTVVSESNARFVNVEPAPRWSNDGRSFYLLSQRGLTQSLYRVNLATGSARRITGTYTVQSLVRIDEAQNAAYVQAYYPARTDRSFLRVRLTDGAVTNLTPPAGNHTIVMPRRGDAFIETASAYNIPPAVYRRSLSSSSRDVVFRTPDLRRFHLGTARPVHVPSAWGLLDAKLVVPADFNPHKRYPVIFTPYGGPVGVGDNEAVNRWSGLYPYFLAQHGYLVFSVSGPASNVERTSAERLFFHSMGQIAMQGQLAGARWMAKQPFADAKRFGLTGWSYGGYLTAFTLTHAPGVFRSGIAGAPPADWRYYDTAYTERYMGTPQQQPAAYRAMSVLPAAQNLRDALLIVQGTSDDNVHLMNSLALLDAFMRAGKRIDYFVYPGERHGPRKFFHIRDLYGRMLDFWSRTLSSH